MRQMGGTLEVAAAFQNRQIAGAVTGDLRVSATEPAEDSPAARRSGHSLLDEHARGFARDVEARSGHGRRKSVRAYAEGRRIHEPEQKERALRIIAKYARHDGPQADRRVHYRDSVTYLDRIPRAEPEAVQTILEFIGKRVSRRRRLSG